MCSRYSLTSPPEAVRAYFRYDNEAVFPPRYNIAPSQPVAIVRDTHNGGRELALVRWGLIPSWVKGPREFRMMINARSETAAEKPSFRAAMRHRRCLVPTDGFYEWTGAAGAKRPHLVRLRECGPMGMAGIYEHWQGADGSENLYVVGTSLVTPSTRGAKPGKGGINHLLNEIKMKVPYDAPNIKTVFASERAGRGTAAALLASSNHRPILKLFRDFS